MLQFSQLCAILCLVMLMNKNEIMAIRLKECRKSKGNTLEEIGKLLNVHKSTVLRWENGEIEKLGLATIEFLATYYDVDPAWLSGFDVPIKKINDELKNLPPNVFPIPKMKKVPLLGDIACGVPIFAEEQYGEYIECDIQADFCLRASGDSMIGARILDGDIVFIKKQEMVENGEIAAVLIDNEATLKRVYYYPDKAKIILSPENAQYEPFVYVGEELNEIKILGKAVAFQSSVR